MLTLLKHNCNVIWITIFPCVTPFVLPPLLPPPSSLLPPPLPPFPLPSLAQVGLLGAYTAGTYVDSMWGVAQFSLSNKSPCTCAFVGDKSCFCLFLTWKKYDNSGATYQNLHTTLHGQVQYLLWQKPSELLVETSGKYTFWVLLWCIYMQISMVVDAGSSEAGGTSTGVENKSTQWTSPGQVCGVAMVTVVVQIGTS